MALVFTFPCGRCGREYTVYYPKSVYYALMGTGVKEMGEKEDEEERRSGAVDAVRARAEKAGRTFVDTGQTLEITCECGKKLDLNPLHHPRVPTAHRAPVKREVGMIPFPEIKKKE